MQVRRSNAGVPMRLSLGIMLLTGTLCLYIYELYHAQQIELEFLRAKVQFLQEVIQTESQTQEMIPQVDKDAMDLIDYLTFINEQLRQKTRICKKEKTDCTERLRNKNVSQRSTRKYP
jgi:hypothetical protein